MVELNLTDAQEKRALALHQRAIVVDMLWSTNPALPTPVIDGKNSLDRALAVGLAAANNTISGSKNTFRETIKEINMVYRLLDTVPDKVLLVRTAADIERAKAEGKLGTILGFQTGAPLENDWINTLPAMDKLGVRIISPTYNERNLLGAGCLEPVDDGLTAYGRQVIGGMNSRGIMADLSHVGEKTAMDCIKASKDPVVLSHSNVKALNSHPRNVSDDLIKAMADKGGVMGVVAWTVLLERPDGTATLDVLLDHIDYVAKLVGVDHVGIGSDINENYRAMPIRSDFETQYSFMLKGKQTAPAAEGFQWINEFPNVTRGLVARGYSDEDVLKVLGGNFMRVARQVWKA